MEKFLEIFSRILKIILIGLSIYVAYLALVDLDKLMANGIILILGLPIYVLFLVYYIQQKK